jgi:hypothetical protein
VLHRAGHDEEAAHALAEARELFTSRARFVWTWFHGATDAEVLAELASTLAAVGRTEEALHALRRAADAGWADIVALRHDPAFAGLRDRPDVRQLAAAAAARVELPPPVGSGGLA